MEEVDKGSVPGDYKDAELDIEEGNNDGGGFVRWAFGGLG